MRHFTFSMLFIVAVAIFSGCESMFPSSDFHSGEALVSAGATSVVCTTIYPDADDDGFGSMDPMKPIIVCGGSASVPGLHFTLKSGDCDDGNPKINPGASESCNGIDDNCDGKTDETTRSYWLDADGDGFGNPKFEHVGPCTGVEPWFVANKGDCDDDPKTGKAVNPAAKETCDTPGVDDNCNGKTDEGVLSEFHEDIDGDGRGSKYPLKIIWACAPSKNVVVSNDDCDDDDVKNFPGNVEVCDGKDNNCNGQTDEGTKNKYFKDKDKDGYGDKDDPVLACDVSSETTTNSADCNDDPAKGGATIFPGASESCNGVDDNCNQVIDEGVKLKFCADVDGDGHGNEALTFVGCKPTYDPVAKYAFVASCDDCDDSDNKTYPGAKEICDGKVNACVGALVEPDSLCEDGDKFTKDKCDGVGACKHTDELMLLDCSLSPEFTKLEGYACSVAYMYEYGPQKYSPMVTGTDSASLLMKKVCAELKAGAILHVNAYAFVDFDPAANWMGGEFTKLIDSFTNAAAGALPGNVTLGSELDFNYTLKEIKACQ